jgi:hypothetical protein
MLQNPEQTATDKRSAKAAPEESEASPKLLSSRTGKDWLSLDLAGKATDNLDRFHRSISDILQSQNLVVLTGLGPTLYVKDAKGQRVAPTMGDLWEEVSKHTDFAKVIKQVNYPLNSGAAAKNDIELLLSHCQMSQVLNKDDAVQRFIELTEEMIVKRCSFVCDELQLQTHQSFLRKVARRSTRLPRMKLFTTNYDLCFETAASRTGFVVVDGFSHTQPQAFDGGHFDYDFVRRTPNQETPDYIPNVFHLYKIHGSVDWALDEEDKQIRREAKPKRPHLIYPRHSKFESSYDQPFLEMMSRLQIALRLPNTGLLIIGFGFSDHHITQPVMAAIESNVSLKCMIVSPSLEESSTSHRDISKIAGLIRGGDLRLSLLSGGFEELVPVIPDLVAHTEDERHRARVMGVRAES